MCSIVTSNKYKLAPFYWPTLYSYESSSEELDSNLFSEIAKINNLE